MNIQDNIHADNIDNIIKGICWDLQIFNNEFYKFEFLYIVVKNKEMKIYLLSHTESN